MDLQNGWIFLKGSIEKNDYLDQFLEQIEPFDFYREIFLECLLREMAI